MVSTQPFHKILVANRGEIAVRVIKTAHQQGYATVAVYSTAEPDALHVLLADEAVCLGDGAIADSYLNADKVLHAATITGADAIHPGYGFLSENAEFAARCRKQGIKFIGPSESAISLMGNKRQAKIAMQKSGIPCVPGYDGDSQDDAQLISNANQIGYPVMIKASAGGGGRGMRLTQSEAEMKVLIHTARSEAEKAFGNGELILEKAIIKPHHIEIQIFADQQGNVVYLGERDCSIQRRHQKVVEESPSPFVDDKLRSRMGKTAVAVASACQYEGAGTVEFLVDEDKNFYFLEMNTRLQVEHPVTEMVTGQDLVAWQLQVAAGEPLPLCQKEIKLQGHAIEVRLYAEDSTQKFMPQTGKFHYVSFPSTGVRIDSGIQSGFKVTPHYDPMLAKLIGYGQNREQARRRLVRALDATTLFGVTTNAVFVSNIIKHEVFISGKATTAFIENEFADDESLFPSTPDDKAITLATTIFYQHGKPGNPAIQNRKTLALDSFERCNWSNGTHTAWPFKLGYNETRIVTSLAVCGNVFQLDSAPFHIRLISFSKNNVVFIYQNIRQQCLYYLHGTSLFLKLDGKYQHIIDLTCQPESDTETVGNGEVKASMDGAIIKVLVKPGEKVEPGQTLVILEAMKMEHPLKSNVSGIVDLVSVAEGDQVKIRQLLITILPDQKNSL